MLRYDKSYSEYNNDPTDDYPDGSAADATSEDNIDGTPYVAAFFNDVIGFFQAAFYGVFGKSASVSGVSENANKSDVWSAIKKFVGDSVDAARTELQKAIDAINSLIPAQANTGNQLADKDFVNSSIATNTAYYIGTYDTLDALKAQTDYPVTNNDYAFVTRTDSAGNVLYDRYKYNGEAQEWLFEYSLNNTGFTAQQAAAINSGITAAKVAGMVNMRGASSGAGGAAGYVPAPGAGQQGAFLRGDGAWATPAASVNFVNWGARLDIKGSIAANATYTLASAKFFVFTVAASPGFAGILYINDIEVLNAQYNIYSQASYCVGVNALSVFLPSGTRLKFSGDARMINAASLYSLL